MRIRSAATHASAAYLACISTSKALIEQMTEDLEVPLHTEEAVEHLNSIISDVVEGGMSAEAITLFTQKQLSHMVDQAVSLTLHTLIDSTRDKARLG